MLFVKKNSNKLCRNILNYSKSIFRGAMVIKKIISLLLVFLMVANVCVVSGETLDIPVATEPAGLEISAKAFVLMEASTGKIIVENNADERLSPASITKIMTLLLIFNELEAGKIKLDDMVTTSEYARSMTGSKVFLETGETQTVETMIKCIAVASGNDASVAMAEFISGTEAEFVNKMNEKAVELGLENTHFVDCCGLSDSDEHYMSARDVAILSRELTVKYPEIFEYTGIWMENITHVTKQGSKEFCLSSTNKLLKQYQWATGLKTGSTSKAKYCLSATASKDSVDMIAVIMAATDFKIRFSEAAKLLEYGFNSCKVYKDTEKNNISGVKVNGGEKELVGGYAEGGFSYLSTDGSNVDNVNKKVRLNDELKAPVKKGDIIGKIEYYLNDKKIGEVNVLAKENIDKAGFMFVLKETFRKMLL